jgi:hypothetical protein
VASRGLPNVLALEIPTTGRTAQSTSRNWRAYSPNEHRESVWGAPRIHGELLKLGIDVGQTTVAKYMAKKRRPPSQRWKTFLRNHADGIASVHMFVVPTGANRT